MPPLGRDLPGLYYDPERGRYFPLSSRPGGPPKQPPDTLSARAEHQRKRARYPSSLHASLRDIKSCSSKPWDRRNIFRAQTATQYARTSFSTTETISGANITSYSVSSLDDTQQIAGDAAGFIWSLSERLESSGLDGPLRRGLQWQAQYGLMSRISSTAIVGDRFFAASFGPLPTILYGTLPLNSDDDTIPEAKLNIITPRHQWDTWSGLFDSSSFVLGLTRHIWFVPDLENLRSSRMFHQEADILSLARLPMVLTNGVVSGARNGCVRLYDRRVVHASPRTETASIGQEILQARSSVTNIQAIREWEFLVSAVNGDIDIYDIRSLRTTRTTSRRNPPKGEWTPNESRGRIPILSLEGHRSTFSINLPLALDPRRTSFLPQEKIRKYGLGTLVMESPS
ncbi:hypothetical protein BS47DRAFT_1487145 [Hydnum rufescens UP504]|uniref:Uncharacterized protein n=1 Tax=Hydnum rufescens UP504 TaxID=1448309 RepID=A0A9P6AS62_9AGAM|nr:hypothetical protein BS47DRAFT_1487145 [Hydnum rufescens UP504]